jgi:probable HAF family extracellular repeat protein
MKSRTLTCITALTLFGALTLPLQLVAQQQQKKELPRYTVTDLGTLGGTFSVAFNINNKHWVDGSATILNDAALRAFLWREGVMTDLGTLGGPNSSASFPLNERGEITGFSDTSTPDPLGENFCGFSTGLTCLPFVWQKGVMNRLPTLGGNNGQAGEVNNRGQVVGLAENTTHDSTCTAPQVLQIRPVLWEKGQPQELPTFPGDSDGVATAINDKGQVVGNSGECATPGFHALLWQDGVATNLGNLGGTMGNVPQDINNQGQVVGFSGLPGNTTVHAFLWENGVMSDLGSLPQPLGIASLGFSVNEKGQVVGTSIDEQGDPHAFIWQQGVMTELNDLTPANSPLFLLDGFNINSRGEIVGDGFQVSTGEVHAYLAVPNHSEVSESATSAAPVETRPRLVLPENVRNMLRQRLAQRYHISGFGAPRN